MIRAALAVARHPRLWATAIGQGRRMARRRWWAQPPFLPVPGRRYLDFRLGTQYGSTDQPFSPDDLIAYLGWCREWNRRRDHGHRTSGSDTGSRRT